MLPRLMCLLVLVAVAPALAQAPDPQSKFEPRSKPGVGQKFLERFVGDWDVAKTFYPRSGPAVRQSGTCRQTMIHDGRFLQSEFTFESERGRSTGLGLLGYDSDTGKFTSVWTDARSTRMSFRQSDGPFDGVEIVLFGRTLGTDVKGPPRSRTRTQLEDDGRRLVHRQHSLQADGSERLVMELVLTRKNGKAPTGK